MAECLCSIDSPFPIVSAVITYKVKFTDVPQFLEVSKLQEHAFEIHKYNCRKHILKNKQNRNDTSKTTFHISVQKSSQFSINCTAGVNNNLHLVTVQTEGQLQTARQAVRHRTQDRQPTKLHQKH